METKFFLVPGTMIRVDSLLKKKGSQYFTHMQCVVTENGRSTDKVYAIPISYFLMEPTSFIVQEELKSKYQANHIPYMNKKFDKKMFLWLRDKIQRFMFITVVDNVIGPTNTDPSKLRPWAVWKWDVEVPAYYPEDDDY